MSDTSSTRLEHRYAYLASCLKACWAFERFFNRLRRVQAGHLEDPGLDLVATQTQLKAIAADLGTAPADDLARRLAHIETDLQQSAARLRAEDSRIGASDLRRFLGRVRRLDEDLLLGMLQFYLYSSRGAPWNATLVDKVDFLLSRLGEQVSGPLLNRDLVRLESALKALWRGASTEPARPTVARAMRESVEELSARLGEVDSLDELEELAVIPEYRRLKHGIGRLLVEPSIAAVVIDTNAHLGRTLQRLFGEEEWRIAAEFTRFSELEKVTGLSEALSIELASLRRDMERLEQGRRMDDVRFDDVQSVRRQVRILRPQLPDKPASVAAPIDLAADAAGEELAPQPERDLAQEPDGPGAWPRSPTWLRSWWRGCSISSRVCWRRAGRSPRRRTYCWTRVFRSIWSAAKSPLFCGCAITFTVTAE